MWTLWTGTEECSETAEKGVNRDRTRFTAFSVVSAPSIPMRRSAICLKRGVLAGETAGVPDSFPEYFWAVGPLPYENDRQDAAVR